MEEESNSTESSDLDISNTLKSSNYTQDWNYMKVDVINRISRTVQVDSETEWRFVITECTDSATRGNRTETAFNAKLLKSAREPLAARITVCAYYRSPNKASELVMEHNFRVNKSISKAFSEDTRLALTNYSQTRLNDNLFIKINIQTPCLSSLDGGHFLSKTLQDKSIPASRLVEDLLLQDESKDVLIRCGEESEFKAHKFLLIARSEVFRKMFSNNMKEARENVIKITDIEPEIVEQMLHYMYTDRVELECQNKLMQLLLAADKYQLTHLKLLCQLILLKTLSVESCLTLLVFCDFHKLKIKEYILVYVAAFVKEIIATDDWKKMMKENCKLAEEVIEKVVLRVPNELEFLPHNLS